jgi:hypothetical protein
MLMPKNEQESQGRMTSVVHLQVVSANVIVFPSEMMFD